MNFDHSSINLEKLMNISRLLVFHSLINVSLIFEELFWIFVFSSIYFHLYLNEILFGISRLVI